MREADFAKPIPVVSTRVRHAADLRAEALKIIDQARQVDAEVNEAEEQEFLARCGDRVIRVVCDGCFGIGCTCCNDTGFNYRARFMGRGRHNPMFVERVDEIRDILLADTWRSNDGRLMNPSDFHDGHLVNTVKLIRRERFQFGRPRIYDLLLAEVKKRELNVSEHYTSTTDQVQHDIDEL